MKKRSFEKQLPITSTNCELISNDELRFIIGGLTTEAVIGIIGGCFAIGAGIHEIGRIAGERVYHAGYPNSEYQKYKWAIRAGVIAINPIIGALVMTGFENRYYELVEQRG